MPSFTPPYDDVIPPVYVGGQDRYYPVPSLSQRLFRHYTRRARGRNVYKLIDGTYTETQPYEATPGTVIAHVYLGGHIEPVMTAEAAALTAAGYGAYIT